MASFTVLDAQRYTALATNDLAAAKAGPAAIPSIAAAANAAAAQPLAPPEAAGELAVPVLLCVRKKIFAR